MAPARHRLLRFRRKSISHQAESFLEVRSLSIPKVVPENGIKAVIDGLNADVYERYLSYIGEVAPGNNVVRAPNEGCPCRTVAESRKQLVNRRLGARNGPDEPKVFVL